MSAFVRVQANIIKEETMHIGLDFGTTTTVASVFDGQTLRLIPLDPSDATPEVLRSVC